MYISFTARVIVVISMTFCQYRLEMKLNIYYTQRNNELLIPIRNQIELDRAIELLDCAPTQRSLRLILSKHQPDKGLPSTVYNSLAPDASGTYSATSSNIVEVLDS